MTSLVVADIEEDVILGMDLLSQVGATLDIVQGTFTVNGEVIDCHDSQNQLLSFRCMVRRSVIVDANSEVVIPVTIKSSTYAINYRPRFAYFGILQQLTFTRKGTIHCKNISKCRRCFNCASMNPESV